MCYLQYILICLLIISSLNCQSSTITFNKLGCSIGYQQCDDQVIQPNSCIYLPHHKNQPPTPNSLLTCLQGCCHSQQTSFNIILQNCYQLQTEQENQQKMGMILIVIGCGLITLCLLITCYFLSKFRDNVDMELSFVWKKGQIVGIKEDAICKVCNNPQPLLVTSCGHAFHTNCILSFLRQDDYCPSCNSRQYNPIKVYCKGCRIKNMSFYINQKTQMHAITQYYGTFCENCTISNVLHHNKLMASEHALTKQYTTQQ